MRKKLWLFNFLLIIVGFIATSCNDNKDANDTDPIKLSYVDNQYIFDNEAKSISITLTGESLPMRINGGDGNFTITNNDEEILEYNLDDKILVIKGVSLGTGSVKISDSSNNNYTLTVTVFGSRPATTYLFPLVYEDNMDADKKATLEEKIIADFPKGEWKFYPGNAYIEVGKQYVARLYLTDDEDSEYMEYACITIPPKDVPHQFLPVLFSAQMLNLCFLMKSDTEEFIIYTCLPFHLDDGRLVRGYNSVMDITHRYITEYPEIKRAYVIITGSPVE